MNKGIEFKIPNEFVNYLKQIFDKVDSTNYIWKIEETEAYIDGVTNLFEMDKYSNHDFKNIISQEKYYTVFANIKLYETEDKIVIRNYSDFLNSSCILILFITDNVFVEVYSKSEDILKIIYENALKSKFTGLNYITENNIKRKDFSAYSDWYHGGAIGDRDFFNKLFISNMTKQKA